MPPSFETATPDIVISVGQSETWALPNIDSGFFTLDRIDFEPDANIAPYLSFDNSSTSIKYNGSPTVVNLNEISLSVKITLVNSINQAQEYVL